ncbi:acyl-CoA dehydrogenase [Haloarcula sp. S1CR25-12]|uniref:Acyl-CoA dehydrogenase n=1 Tax=Haloarcula saliterrae TaxID=2950534 RepID=A0ABU2FGM2_9EURY|nr:acyl-CoA dehydrogenase [Haloarcula sp. S1CR25-12]MDS0261392.1 acyl-CoA dehydrogenase [Haloarcula sp. S1CR25-12]
MTNFKSGSGNLDFGGDSDEESTGERADTEVAGSSTADPDGSETAGATVDGDATDDRPSTRRSGGETYPYFVRRNNVGDERDTRLEIHVRDKVADQEAGFRHDLAEQLGASDVSKTDAREFALLAAFEHPERVAELMREEGFDSLG